MLIASLPYKLTLSHYNIKTCSLMSIQLLNAGALSSVRVFTNLTVYILPELTSSAQMLAHLLSQ